MDTYTRWLNGLKDKASGRKPKSAKAKKSKAKRRAARKEAKKPKLAPGLIPRLGPPHPEYVRDDGFYKSDDWRKLRYLALRNCKGCQCCGAKASDGVHLHVDHIFPRYKYPHLSLKLENLQVLCDDCNMGKGAWDDTDWRIKL